MHSLNSPNKCGTHRSFVRGVWALKAVVCEFMSFWGVNLHSELRYIHAVDTRNPALHDPKYLIYGEIFY